jgi:hypothetical protein
MKHEIVDLTPRGYVNMKIALVMSINSCTHMTRKSKKSIFNVSEYLLYTECVLSYIGINMKNGLLIGLIKIS